MTMVLQALRAALFTGIMSLIIGIANVRDTPLFMVVLAALFVLHFLEISSPGATSLKSGLKGEDHSRVTTWIIGASFLTNVVLPILDYRYSTPVPQVAWWNWLGLLALIAGSAMRVWSIRVAGDSFKVQIVVTAKQRLVMSGPYAWVRHPSYLGTVISYLGVATIFSSSWGLATLLIIVVPTLIVRLLKEEKLLAAHFGEEWRRYRAQTESRLIPGLW